MKLSEKFAPLCDGIRSFYSTYGAVAEKLLHHSNEAIMIAIDRKHNKKCWRFTRDGLRKSCAEVVGAWSWHTNGGGEIWHEFEASTEEVAAAILAFEPAKGLEPQNFVGFMIAKLTKIASKAPKE